MKFASFFVLVLFLQAACSSNESNGDRIVDAILGPLKTSIQNACDCGDQTACEDDDLNTTADDLECIREALNNSEDEGLSESVDCYVDLLERYATCSGESSSCVENEITCDIFVCEGATQEETSMHVSEIIFFDASCP